MPAPYFHKLILSKHVQDKKLRMPEGFVKKYGSELSTYARLAVPDGHVWRIGLVKVAGSYWLNDKWEEFMNRYSISVGYFVVFKYQGNALFNVYIFNLSASEINYQSNALSGKRSFIFEEMEEEESAEKSDVFFHSPVVQSIFHESKLNHINWMGDNSQSSDHSPRDGASPFAIVERDEFTISKPKRRGKKKRENDCELPQDDSVMRLRFYESASARKRTVTAEERERAINAAKAFEPVNPFCRVVLRPSYLYRGCIMYLPSCFAEKHLNGVCGFIRLQLTEGKQWSVRCLFRGGRAKLSQGWYEFTLENNMGEGDVCVFELLKPRDVVLKVTVFRVVENAAFLDRV